MDKDRATAQGGLMARRCILFASAASAALLLAACASETSERLGTVTDARSSSARADPTVEPSGRVGHDRSTHRADGPEASFPAAIRGEWRETDGPAPSAPECDRGDYGNAGRILTIEVDRFGYFEEGGRLLEAKERSAGHVRAIFDTSYAEPRRDDLAFDVDPVARTLTVTDMERGLASRRVFRRCPR